MKTSEWLMITTTSSSSRLRYCQFFNDIMPSRLIIFTSFFLVIQVFSQRFRNEVNQNYASQRSNLGFSCPDKNGRYPTGACDGYIECKDGIAEEKVCPDGLLFNAANDAFSFPCQYPIDVDCSGREQTQPAQSTEECPHQFGYFRMGDENNCGQFKNCVDGRGFIFDCPEGLAFNGDTYRCDWPDQVKTCNAESFLGFTCPPEARNLAEEAFLYYRSPNDCQKYFICINGRPRVYNCGEGRAFNVYENVCDGIENVTDCHVPQYNNKFARLS